MDKSGKILIRVPKTLHEALSDEAELEDVSMNQLIVAKLSVGLGTLVSARKPRAPRAATNTNAEPSTP